MEDNKRQSDERKQVVVPYDEYQDMVQKLESNTIAIIFSAREDFYCYPNATIRKIITKSDGLKDLEVAIHNAFNRILHGQDEYVKHLREEAKKAKEIQYDNEAYYRMMEQRNKSEALLSKEMERTRLLDADIARNKRCIKFLSVALGASLLTNLLFILL